VNEKDIQRARQEVKEAWEFVMSTQQGRLVVRDVLRMTGLGLSPFAGGATNQTIKNVGMQDVGLQVTARAKQHAFDHYLTLMREENEHV